MLAGVTLESRNNDGTAGGNINIARMRVEYIFNGVEMQVLASMQLAWEILMPTDSSAVETK